MFVYRIWKVTLHVYHVMECIYMNVYVSGLNSYQLACRRDAINSTYVTRCTASMHLH